jgi:hypothetical protein
MDIGPGVIGPGVKHFGLLVWRGPLNLDRKSLILDHLGIRHKVL